MPCLAHDHIDKGERLMTNGEEMHEDEFLSLELCDDTTIYYT